jgi:hypothetical protein
MVEIAQAQRAAGGDHVALVDAKPERHGEAQPQQGGDSKNQDQLVCG